MPATIIVVIADRGQQGRRREPDASQAGRRLRRQRVEDHQAHQPQPDPAGYALQRPARYRVGNAVRVDQEGSTGMRSSIPRIPWTGWRPPRHNAGPGPARDEPEEAKKTLQGKHTGRRQPWRAQQGYDALRHAARERRRLSRPNPASADSISGNVAGTGITTA